MHRHRALVLALLLILVGFVGLRGSVDSGAAAPEPAPASAGPPSEPPAAPGRGRGERLGPPTPSVAELARADARAQERARAARERRHEAARRAEARRLRRSRTVAGALRRAWLSRAISRRQYDGLRSTWFRARRDVGRLSGVRRAELGSVLAMASELASARLLTASRLEPVFLTIRRNREFWMSRALPAPGSRLTFRGDPVIFEYYSGRGLAIQPLANFGAANALAGSCLRRVRRHTCRPAALRRLLERMVALGTQRGGFLAWEYFVRIGRGAPPWISAMTQATGAQALARGRRALREPRFGRASRHALRAFDHAPPLGVSVAHPRGRRYTMYSFSPGLRIYNGELQALIGLRDVARIANSRHAQRLYRAGEPVARRAVAALDTGAWSIYSEGGRESTLEYHRLVATFLDGMCSRTRTRTYCAAGRRLARYVGEAPRLGVRTLKRPRVRRRAAITLTLSKVSTVTVQIRDRRGRVALGRGMRLSRGRHRLVWAPRIAGRHSLKIVALGPAGTRGVVTRTLTARVADKKKKVKKGKRDARSSAEVKRSAR